MSSMLDVLKGKKHFKKWILLIKKLVHTLNYCTLIILHIIVISKLLSLSINICYECNNLLITTLIAVVIRSLQDAYINVSG